MVAMPDDAVEARHQEEEGQFAVTTGPRERRSSSVSSATGASVPAQAHKPKLPSLVIDVDHGSESCHGQDHDHSHGRGHGHAHGHGHSHGHSHGQKQKEKEKKAFEEDLHDHEDHDHDEFAIDDSAVHKLKQACMTSTIFMLMQFLGGYYAGSLAIMTDAAHLLSDVASFLVSLFAIYIGSRAANARMPFGYHRAEVLGALISVVIIWVLTGGLLYAAVMRLIEQSRPDAENTVDGRLMFLVSGCGLFLNLVLMRILGHGHSHSHGGHSHSHGHGHSHSHGHGHGHGHSHGSKDDVHVEGKHDGVQPSPNTQDGSMFLKTPMSAVALIDIADCDDDDESSGTHHAADFENINLRAAYIHALGDFIQSLGVCVAGALIWYNPSWQMADPITTLLFSCLVLATTYGIFIRSLTILMEGAPLHLRLETVEKKIRMLDAVYDCHDLRIWSLTEGRLAASVHVLANGDHKAALKQTQRLLKRYGVQVQTVQVETPADYDWEDEGDTFCMNTTFSTSEVMMSVPRAATARAATPKFTIDEE